MTDQDDTRLSLAQWFDTSVLEPMDDFNNPSQEWRRLFSEGFNHAATRSD